MKCLRPGLLLALLLVAASPVRAEDPPAAPGGDEDPPAVDAPSPLTELREEHLARDAEPVDPIEYLRSYRDWLALHEEPPPRTERDRGLHDVWSAVLKNRAWKMRKRVDTLMKRKYWLPEEGTPVRVKPEHWSRFVREIAALMTELHGAWKGYQDADLTDRRTFADVPATRTRDPGGYWGYGHPAGLWRGAVLGRQSVGDRRLHHELHSYWNLLHTYRRGWGWRIAHCYGCELKRRELQRKKAEYVAERTQVLHTTRDTLEQQMISLQILAAAMQAQEEATLRAALDALPRDHLLRGTAEQVLTSLRDARLKAERYSGSASSAYGHLLRGWVRAYKAGTALLEEEAERLEDDDDDAAADDAGNDPSGNDRDE